MSAEPKNPALVLSAAEPLRRFVHDVFVRVGMTSDHAQIVAEVLVWANLRGVDTHGVTRLPRYVELIELGDINPKPAITQREVGAAAALVLADRAAGPVAMMHAMRESLRGARQAGIGLALVRGTTHTAALGYYTRHAAREGAAAIAFSSSQPNMVYHGARAPGVATSPLSIAVPGGKHGPVVLDFGSGVVSAGRLVQARKLGQPIPLGWALDKSGQPTTDPAQAHVPLPIAGPKGSGLSLMIELLSSVLATNPLLAETLEKTELGRHHRQNAATIAIDIARFTDPAIFASEVERLARDLKALPRALPDQEILLPGEHGDRILAQRSLGGIPIPAPVFGELRALAERLGVALFPTEAS
jgi:LDH2 family malate/lactate/ureidoglycolate dehydrogenase